MNIVTKQVTGHAVRWFGQGDHPRVYSKRDSASDLWGYIQTMHGEIVVIPGDWIVTLGDHTFPVKPEMFDLFYQNIDGSECETAEQVAS